MTHRTESWLSALVVVLALPADLIGLLRPSVYRDPAVLMPQNLGTDLVTLAVGIPLPLAGAVAMRHGSVRGRLVWLAALGYLVYAYGMYALGVRWNELFVVYIALFGLSLYALVIGLLGTDAAAVRAALATIGLWVVAMIWFMSRGGYVTPAPYTALFALLTVAGAALAWRFTAAHGPPVPVT